MSQLQLETVQWATVPDVDDVSPIGDKDHQVLSELREVILKHGYADRFGVALLHKHFDLAEDEVLMETTDVEARVSTLHVERLSSQGPGRVLETLWKFARDGGARGVIVCVNRCHYDRGHKMRHHREGR